MKAKLVDGQLVYATNFEIIGKDSVSYPSDEQLITAGFKEVVFEEVDEVIEQYIETEKTIIEYQKKYVPSEFDMI